MGTPSGTRDCPVPSGTMTRCDRQPVSPLVDSEESPSCRYASRSDRHTDDQAAFPRRSPAGQQRPRHHRTTAATVPKNPSHAENLGQPPDKTANPEHSTRLQLEAESASSSNASTAPAARCIAADAQSAPEACLNVANSTKFLKHGDGTWVFPILTHQKRALTANRRCDSTTYVGPAAGPNPTGRIIGASRSAALTCPKAKKKNL